MRDVGGLPTVDGRRTRTGVLVRADNLQGLTDSDVATLVDELGVRTVLDLRTTGERNLTGPGPLVGRVTHHGLSLIPEVPGEPDEVEVERAIPTLAEDPREAAIPADVLAARRGAGPRDMAGWYLGYLEDQPGNLAEALRLLADASNGPTVVHCAAGKDRTGTVVAIALSLAGVTRDAVVADYVASAERAQAVLTRLQATWPYSDELKGKTVDDIRPEAASMEGLLDEIDRRYGGVHGLAMAIGVDEETVAKLAARLVEPVHR